MPNLDFSYFKAIEQISHSFGPTLLFFKVFKYFDLLNFSVISISKLFFQVYNFVLTFYSRLFCCPRLLGPYTFIRIF